jgi:hypothetical protein
MVDWSSLIGGLGIGSLAGGLIQQFVSAKVRHGEWVKDNKKQESRELITALSHSVHRVLRITPHSRFDGIVAIRGEDEKQLLQDFAEADLQARRIIEDRLFISTWVKSENVLERWQLIAAEKDSARILEHWNHLHTALVEFAKRDLDIKEVKPKKKAQPLPDDRQ